MNMSLCARGGQIRGGQTRFLSTAWIQGGNSGQEA